MKKLLIFDLDGTLLDTRKDLARAVNKMREHYNLEHLSLETIVSYVGNGITKLAERALSDCMSDKNKPQSAEAAAVISKYYADKLCVDTRPYPGVVEGLKELCKRNDAKLVVITNKPEVPARELCERTGISDYFDHIFGGDSFNNMKPHPEPLLGALKITDCNIDGSWMIGDNYTDLEAGRRAELSCCFCEYGFGNPKQETGYKTIASFSELLDII